MKYDKERVEHLLHQPRTDDVVEDLIQLNFGLLQRQLHKFYLYNNPDALSYGYEALYKAIMTFDISKNHKFSTYATVCIYNRLGSYIRTLNTDLEINTISYETPINEEGKNLLALLESTDTADGQVLASCGVEEIHKAITSIVVTTPNPLHRSIIQAWVSSDFEDTHTVLAGKLGCTQSYVSQVIKKFKLRLSDKLGENDYE